MFLTASALVPPVGAPLAAAAETREPNRPCQPGGASLTVVVDGFKNRSGIVRAQLYGPEPGNFLAKGKWTMRIERTLPASGPLRFCFPVDKAGRYAVAIRHDANDNEKSDWNDGGGFTRNPHLSLLALKPKFASCAVAVDGAPVTSNITMQYRSGLSIKPI